MAYRKPPHYEKGDCEEVGCKALSTYVRIDGKWTKVGYFGSECKNFDLLDVKQEQQERIQKQRAREIKRIVGNKSKMSHQDFQEWLKDFRERRKELLD